MKRAILKTAKTLLLAAFLIGAFGQTFSTASVTRKKTAYPVNCTFTGNRTDLCHFTLNGGAATADGCTDYGTTCSVIIPE